MKTKKGQILVLVLMVMVIGLIIISPLLSYVSTSYNIYLHNLIDTNAYYTADAMMAKILNDVYSGISVYGQNMSTPYSKKNYLYSGYDIDVVINDSVAQPLPTQQKANDWIYLDPGVTVANPGNAYTLGSLPYGQKYEFPVYLLGNTSVEVNWTFNGTAAILTTCSCGNNCPVTCPYNCIGLIYINNSAGVPQYQVNGSSISKALELHGNWTVPADQSGTYNISFINRSWRYNALQSPSNCVCTGFEGRTANSESFNGSGIYGNGDTWVKIGKQVGGQVYLYQDYTITATAKKNNQNILSITACIRQTPGPLAWWKEQTVEIPSWQIKYY